MQGQSNSIILSWRNFLRVFSRTAYCFSVAGVVREERSKAEKEYFHQLVDAGMCLHMMPCDCEMSEFDAW